jgi:hypothetical protein
MTRNKIFVIFINRKFYFDKSTTLRKLFQIIGNKLFNKIPTNIANISLKLHIYKNYFTLLLVMIQ